MAIIVADQEQVKLLKDQMEYNRMGDILVDTAEGFQGKEKDIVVISCVREPNTRMTMGFLASSQGMNVALTRAKQSLIIIGSCDCLVRFNYSSLYK